MSLRSELELIAQANGGDLSRRNVVDAATPPNHPLHDRFEWDNEIAGDEYRLHQAGQLIRSVKVRFVSPRGPASVRQYHSIRRSEDEPARYEPVDRVVVDPIAEQILVNQMRREFAIFKARYRHLREFIDLLHGEAEAAA